MSHNKAKRASEKQDKLLFFSAKQGQTRGAVIQEESQDGAETDGAQGTHTEAASRILTMEGLQVMFDDMAAKLQSTLQHSFTDLRTDIHKLSSRTSDLENQMEAQSEAHNRLSSKVDEVWDRLNDYEAKIALRICQLTRRGSSTCLSPTCHRTSC
ncbi:Hypothetical predicted protein [Pelobates cultripes]|uniref:Uncharacterized protein n=1 Tax=Pelobates cultripes TaxID=61616 RepID=A0AAD1W6P5_PELCU|nr:Hypothetical predicted protein [Pelobates cultripes]